ncbi:TIGR01777 family oxidoreductase [Anaerolineales bacterium]
MRIIITGGTGLIGKHLIHALQGHDHELIVLSRNPATSDDLPASVKKIKWDAKTVGPWAESLEGADVVINLAGESLAGDGFLPPRWTDERKKSILQSRIDVGQALVAAISQTTNKPKVLIQASAVGYYGPSDDRLLKEDSPAGNDFQAQVCVAWEASTAAVKEQGVKQIPIRIGLVLSKKGGVLSRLILPHKFFVGGPLGSGSQWYPWIHIDDLVSAIIFLMNNSTAQGPYNLTAPNPLTNRDLEKTIAKVMGRPAFMPAPAFALKLALGEVSDLVLNGQRAVPAALEQLGFEFEYKHAEPALRDLLNKPA